MHVIAQSDWVIDIGPGAGDEGGAVVAAGRPDEVARVVGSKTAHYLAAVLSGARRTVVPSQLNLHCSEI
jgi:excinuclease ABC subunit A